MQAMTKSVLSTPGYTERFLVQVHKAGTLRELDQLASGVSLHLTDAQYIQLSRAMSDRSDELCRRVLYGVQHPYPDLFSMRELAYRWASDVNTSVLFRVAGSGSNPLEYPRSTGDNQLISEFGGDAVGKAFNGLCKSGMIRRVMDVYTLGIPYFYFTLYRIRQLDARGFLPYPPCAPAAITEAYTLDLLNSSWASHHYRLGSGHLVPHDDTVSSGLRLRVALSWASHTLSRLWVDNTG